MKFLIVGLGNPGSEYENTRHNIGFDVLDSIANENDQTFSVERYGEISKTKHRGRSLTLLKPNTFMNLSGKAVKYWMTKEKIAAENLLVITDDVNLEFGTIRIKAKGSAGGHNGLRDIEVKLNTQKYPRFRFGIGSDYTKGRQIDFVLGAWKKDEERQLIERIPVAAKAVLSFGTDGIANAMNNFNGK